MKYNPLASHKRGGFLAVCFTHFVHAFLKCSSATLPGSQAAEFEERMEGHTENQVSEVDGVMGSKFPEKAAGIFLSEHGFR